MRGEPDLQCQQQLDGVGEGRGSGQAQQAERAEEKQVGEGPGEGQGVAGAETRQDACRAGCGRSCLCLPWIPAADPTPHRPPSEIGEGGVQNEHDRKSCTKTHSNREQGGDEERGCRGKTLHASTCFWEGGREARERENTRASRPVMPSSLLNPSHGRQGPGQTHRDQTQKKAGEEEKQTRHVTQRISRRTRDIQRLRRKQRKTPRGKRLHPPPAPCSPSSSHQILTRAGPE